VPREPTACLDTNALTWNATKALLALDETFVGTPDYMGLAFFWGQDVKFYLRDATYAQRRKYHAALLKAGKPLTWGGAEAEKLARAICGK
jgi:hypothetical protein